ncbi:hypothetical protein B6U91_00990 [Candidatus Pacearchaeota archaeon ex4484_71]|nr:MAG: hypothetical protein B6U91_00990 [Candidatus Pacearchaeota archaeon ex4484_71]
MALKKILEDLSKKEKLYFWITLTYGSFEDSLGYGSLNFEKDGKEKIFYFGGAEELNPYVCERDGTPLLKSNIRLGDSPWGGYFCAKCRSFYADEKDFQEKEEIIKNWVKEHMKGDEWPGLDEEND